MRASPAFERFERALQPQEIGPSLESALSRRCGPLAIESLQATRAVPRERDAFIVQYRVEVRSPAGPSSLLLCGLVLGPAEDWPSWVESNGDRVCRVAPLGVAIPLFPFDPKLQALPQLVRGDDAPDWADGIAGLPTDGWRAPRVLAYRLGRRCVLRFDRAADGALPAIVKVFRQGNGDALRRAAQFFTTLPADSMPRLARTLKLDADAGLQVQEFVPGASLHDLVGSDTLVPACAAAARELRALHALPAPPLALYVAGDAVHALDGAVDLTARMFGDELAALHAVRAGIVARRPDEPPTYACLHRDFYDKQVLYSEAGATLIDCDTLTGGDPAQDHGNFLAHLELRAEQEPAAAAGLTAAARAFEAEYADPGGDFTSRSRWWRAATLLRLATLYALRPRWRHVVEPLLARADKALSLSALASLLFALAIATTGAPPARAAGTPEYLKLGLRPGQSLEFTGKMNADHLFAATDVEALPTARRPQLRGGIEAIDVAHRRIAVLGLSILVPPDVESGNPDSSRVSLEQLAPGMRVELSCTVKESGDWVAKRIRTQGVKPSDKLKGTLTRVAVDGAPPDTVEVSGFKVLLGSETDLNRRVAGGVELRDVLQADLAAASANDALLGHAYADGRFLVRVQTRGQLVVRRELDLTPHVGSNGEETAPEVRTALTGYFGPHVRTRAQLRAKGRLYLQSQLGSVNSSAVQFLEANVLGKDLFGKGIAIQVGRQDLDEPREWIFNEYQDAIRVAAYGARGFSAEAAVLHAIYPLKPSFDHLTDFYATALWHPNRRSYLGPWMMSRHDQSERGRDPVWFGMRYDGRIGATWRPWAELAMLRGEDKARTLRGWAYDVGGTATATRWRGMPAATLGYAVGSGDASTLDGVDGNFRQTGYQDNYARLGGAAPLKYYGILLDPELSNIEIMTAAIAWRPMPDASIEFLWHRYRQVEASALLRSQNLLDPPARPNGFDDRLGWELDAALASPLIHNSLRVRWSTSMFVPGAAFSPRRERAFLHSLEVTAEL